MKEIQKKLFKSYHVNKKLRPVAEPVAEPAAAAAAAADEPVQKHKVTLGIPGWLNNLYGIINHHKHIWDCFCEIQVAGLRLITMKYIDTGTKTAARTRSPLWRTRLLDSNCMGNDRNFADIFKFISMYAVFWFKLHWNLCRFAQLAISQHWFK